MIDEAKFEVDNLKNAKAKASSLVRISIRENQSGKIEESEITLLKAVQAVEKKNSTDEESRHRVLDEISRALRN